MEGVDYSWEKPGGAALQNAGKKFAMRYVPYRENLEPEIWTGKGLTLSEKADLLNHGISIGMVFETFANRAKEGFAAGQSDARMALDGMAHVGMPSSQPIYFAVDFDANVGQRSWDANVSGAIAQYFNGVASIIGRWRTGVYGGFYVVRWAHANGVATWLWQTYAWSGGLLYSGTHVYQYDNTANINGASVDLNRSLKAYFGQHPIGGSIPDVPDTALPPPKQELPMKIIVPNPPELFRVPAGGVLREHPSLSSGQIRQLNQSQEWTLSGIVPGGKYTADGKESSRWALIWLPAWWTDPNPYDGRWAYFPAARGTRIPLHK